MASARLERTPEERRAKMHELIYGVPGKTALSGGAVAEKLLLGLIFHASRRQAQGMTLTPIHL
ncbi:hypothetical protein ACHAP3_011171, partial [Botrytis cinerea]